MIGGMRKFAKSKWALAVLFIPLVIALAITLPDIGGGGLSGGVVARIGEREVTIRDIERDTQNELERIRQETGRVVTPAEAVTEGIPQRVYGQLELRATMLAFADKVGIKASAESLKPYLERQNALVNEFGQLTRDSIIRAAQQRQQTTREFEQFLQDYLTTQYISMAAGSALTVPDILSQPWINYLGETRTISFGLINASTTAAPAEPTDAEMETWYNTNVARFQQRERRRISVLTYTPDDFLDRVEMTEEQIRAEYQKRIKEYSTPETRVVVEFEGESRSAVQAFVDLAVQGIPVEEALAQTPGLVRKESTIKPEDITLEGYRDLLFSLEPGKVHSIPIRINEGDPWKAVMIQSVTPGVPTPYEEIADKVRRDVLWPEAVIAFEASADTFRDAAGGQPLEDIGKQFGIPVITLAPIDEQARTAQGDQAQIMAQNVDAFRQLFTLNAGEMTNVFEGDNVRSMFRLDEIIAPYTQPFAEVKDRVKFAMMTERAIAARKAAADGMVAAVKAGATFEKAAADAKMSTVLATPFKRDAQNADPAVLAAAFNLKPGEVAVVSGRDGNPWVVRIDRVEAVTPTDSMILRAQNAGAFNDSLIRDINEVFVRGLQAEVDSKIDEEALDAYFTGLRGDQPQQ